MKFKNKLLLENCSIIQILQIHISNILYLLRWVTLLTHSTGRKKRKDQIIN